ncbi:unnamed protein product, partial [Acanthoscelides obtectus]
LKYHRVFPSTRANLNKSKRISKLSLPSRSANPGSPEANNKKKVQTLQTHGVVLHTSLCGNLDHYNSLPVYRYAFDSIWNKIRLIFELLLGESNKKKHKSKLLNLESDFLSRNVEFVRSKIGKLCRGVRGNWTQDMMSEALQLLRSDSSTDNAQQFVVDELMMLETQESQAQFQVPNTPNRCLLPPTSRLETPTTSSSDSQQTTSEPLLCLRNEFSPRLVFYATNAAIDWIVECAVTVAACGDSMAACCDWPESWLLGAAGGGGGLTASAGNACCISCM